MKTFIFTIITLFLIIIVGCTNKAPFKPALKQEILTVIDSLQNQIESNKLLSIQFFNSKDKNTECDMRVFLSDWYASASVDGYAKIGKTTIAFYNLQYDFYELVNKNDIIFFNDTIMGFKDICGWQTSETGAEYKLPEFLYQVLSDDSISEMPDKQGFGFFYKPDNIRLDKCFKQGRGIILFVPESDMFYLDSIQAEEKLEFYKKEVEYYQNKKKKVKK